MGQIAAPAEEVKKSAVIMETTEKEITGVINKVMGEVEAMLYVAASATTFKAKMHEWEGKARTITSDLLVMAGKLHATSAAILKAEDQSGTLAQGAGGR